MFQILLDHLKKKVIVKKKKKKKVLKQLVFQNIVTCLTSQVNYFYFCFERHSY